MLFRRCYASAAICIKRVFEFISVTTVPQNSCAKTGDVQPLCAGNNKCSDILPLNFRLRVELKLINFSKTNYPNYVHYF